jgi:hypothetical protein
MSPEAFDGMNPPAREERSRRLARLLACALLASAAPATGPGCSRLEPSLNLEKRSSAANLERTPTPLFEEEARAAALPGPGPLPHSTAQAALNQNDQNVATAPASMARKGRAAPVSAAAPKGDGREARAVAAPAVSEPPPAAAGGSAVAPSALRSDHDEPEAAPTGAAKSSGSAASSSYREPPSSAPSAGGLSAPATARAEAQGADPLEDLFRAYRDRIREGAARPPADDYEAIERADVEGKLIALFFLRERRNLEDYRDLIRSFREEGPVNVELELLKAALYQKIGQADLRDRALERAGTASSSGSAALRLSQLAFASEIRGYRSFTRRTAPDFAAGEELLIYGEIEGFKNSPAPGAAGAPAHRRSFSAELVLKGADGAEVDRRELLKAGQAAEVVDNPAKPVHFWGRYPVPAQLAPGRYRLWVEATDLESQRKTHAALPLQVK